MTRAARRVVRLATVIALGAVNLNVAQSNAGAFIGEINISGWDSNQKSNYGSGLQFGWFNYSVWSLSANFDGGEWLDGIIIDPDVKPLHAVQW